MSQQVRGRRLACAQPGHRPATPRGAAVRRPAQPAHQRRQRGPTWRVAVQTRSLHMSDPNATDFRPSADLEVPASGSTAGPVFSQKKRKPAASCCAEHGNECGGHGRDIRRHCFARASTSSTTTPSTSSPARRRWDALFDIIKSENEAGPARRENPATARDSWEASRRFWRGGLVEAGG